MIPPQTDLPDQVCSGHVATVAGFTFMDLPLGGPISRSNVRRLPCDRHECGHIRRIRRTRPQ